MSELRNASLILKVSDLTQNTKTGIGECNDTFTNFTWYGINLRTVLGDMYDDYEYFNLCLNAIRFGNVSGINIATNEDTCFTINVSGLPFTNQTYNHATRNNNTTTCMGSIGLKSGQQVILVNSTPQPFNTVNNNTITINSYTGTNAFQNGQYEAKASSVAEGKKAWSMFYGARATDYWHCAYPGFSGYGRNPYSSTTGEYQGGGNASTNYYKTLVGGVNIVGEWVQMKLPYRLNLTTYSLYPRPYYNWASKSPVKFYIVGSNDEINWYQVDYQNLTTYPANFDPLTFSTTTNTNSYIYFRMIINSITLSVYGVIHFSDWTLTGYYSAQNYNTPMNLNFKNIAMFHKNQDVCNVTISFNRVIDGATCTNIFPKSSFIFDIVGVEDSKLQKHTEKLYLPSYGH